MSQAIRWRAGRAHRDGDDANSNSTVDFGFFGFDLVLDKSVEQTRVSPLETVTYTVTVINDGPSTAPERAVRRQPAGGRDVQVAHA